MMAAQRRLGCRAAAWCEAQDALAAINELFDDKLAQAGRRGRSDGAHPKKAGTEAGCLGAPDPTAEARLRTQ
jgi:hypothetical protein